MAIKIKPLRKFTTGVPSTSDMEVGELAVNTADKKIYMRDNTSGASSIVEVANASGSAADDITIGDGEVEIATTAGQITIDNQHSNSDIVFKGNDGGSTITALTLDMSDAGRAIFNKSATFGDTIRIDGDGNKGLLIGDEALSNDNDYVGMKTTNMTGGSDYMILSGLETAQMPDSTFISAKSGNNDFIRGGGNVATHQIEVSASLAKAHGILEVGTRIELGHASDTTLARSSAGTVQIEGNTILTTGNSDSPTTITSSSGVNVLVDDGGTMKKITPTNLGIGSGGGGVTSDAQNNTSGGTNALDSMTSGQANNNTAFGKDALTNNTTADSNTAFGAFALDAATIGGSNNAFGHNALTSLTEGQANSAFGAVALDSLTTGNNNSAFGQGAGDGLTTGGNNITVGHLTMGRHSESDDNVAIGFMSMYGTFVSGGVISNKNVAIGRESLYNMNSGANQNVGIGYRSSYNLSTGDDNVTIGFESAHGLTTGGQNVFIGPSAAKGDGSNAVTGSSNVAIGEMALEKLQAASSLVAVGRLAMRNSHSADNSVAIGTMALEDGTDYSYAVAVGTQALTNLTTGSYNTGVGHSVGAGIEDHTRNSLLGYEAGYNIKGNNNTAIGNQALYYSTTDKTGANNTGLGYRAGFVIEGGDQNTFVGYQSGQAMTTGNNNVFLGGYDGLTGLN